VCYTRSPMREREKLSETAKLLQDRLTAFAAMDSDTQRAYLKQILDVIKASARKDILERLVEREYQERLVTAVEKTTQTDFIAEDTLISPWAGSATMVVVNLEGSILAAASYNTSNQTEDKTPFALAKATTAMHLYQARMFGGLHTVENMDYLARSGAQPLVDIFMGSGRHPIQAETTRLFFGSAGCIPKSDYVKDLLAGAYPSYDTQAGLFDNIFSDIATEYFAYPTVEIRPRPEPNALREMRWRN